MERRWQYSCGTVPPANHMSIGHKHLHDVSSGLRPYLSLLASALKGVVEVEARLLIATHRCWRLIGVWKGYSNTLVALCCLPTM